ncbi:uncharacterized protein LODBEIA_P10210 [Lodderomyces beijingensis]|uniref:C2H2-type domain-containing protein n=1 Tax=Lodderomyces beijingensis TaxID=1775926 RepID=A0ABP0ZKU9_9ASCO
MPAGKRPIEVSGGGGGVEKPKKKAATNTANTSGTSANTNAAATSTNSTTDSRKLPPLASLQSVYRSDYQPFTQFLPYEPAFRDNNRDASNAASSTSEPGTAARGATAAAAAAAAAAATAAAEKNKHTTQPPSMESSINKFKASPTAAAKIEKAVTMANTKNKPFTCTHVNCDWSFARQSDLTRHAKAHTAPQYHCPYWKNDPTCHKNYGAFNRLDVLKRHLKLVHYVKDKQPPVGGGGNSEGANDMSAETERGVSPGDPGWCRACQRMFPNSKAFIEHCHDCARNTQPAEWIENKRTYANTLDEGGGGGGGSNAGAAASQQNTFRVILDHKEKR